MRKKRRKVKGDYSIEDIKQYMALSTKQKLEYLEEINLFLAKVTPAKSKRIWEALKKRGW